MTNTEAHLLAEQLWGADGIVNVAPLPDHPDEWLVETIGRVHLLNADGRPSCHRACIARAARELEPAK